MSRRFQHAPTVTVARGKWRVTCCCGWPGERTSTQVEAMSAYQQHVGHRELKEKPQVDVSLDPRDAMIASEMLLESARFPALWLH